MTTTILCGDALETLKTLESGSISCCVTSPPYYGLRDYGVDGQIGLEETPEKYIDRLVAVFREVKRVLRDDGTLWLNIADSYAGSGKGAAQYPENAQKYKQGTNKGTVGQKAICSVHGVGGGIKAKDLIGIPWMLAFALRADGWYLRQDIIWAKPNPMPESVRDRCTKSHEYIFLLSKSARYYFDKDSIEEPAHYDGRNDTEFKGSKKYLENKDLAANGRAHERWKFKTAPRFGGRKYGDNNDPHFQTYSGNEYRVRFKNLQEKGQTTQTMHESRAEGLPDEVYAVRNKRDVWTVTTKPYKGAHFATFPKQLIEPCILAGCPEDGTTLDPFCGSGTTGVVCAENGRN